MTEFGRRQVLLGLALTGGAGLTFASRLERPGTSVSAASLALAAPDRIGEWQSVKLPDFILPVAGNLESEIYDAQVVKGYRDPDGRSTA